MAFHKKNASSDYMIAFLILETLIIGVFCALDLFVFYIFFEASLIPMFLIIGVWGGEGVKTFAGFTMPSRVYAAVKFFLYTLLGSVLLLIAMAWMYVQAGTTDIPTLQQFEFSAEAQKWLWLAFFASFAVKMPMWAGAHLVAGRSRASADGWLGRAGGDPSKNGRLRVLALFLANVPDRQR